MENVKSFTLRLLYLEVLWPVTN